MFYLNSNLTLKKVSSAESFNNFAFQTDDKLLTGNNHWDLWGSHGCFISNKVIPSLCSKFFSSSVFCHSFQSVRNSSIFLWYNINLYIMCFLKAGWTLNWMYRGGFYKASNEPWKSSNLVRQLSLRRTWHKQHIPKHACISFLHASISQLSQEGVRCHTCHRLIWLLFH